MSLDDKDINGATATRLMRLEMHTVIHFLHAKGINLLSQSAPCTHKSCYELGLHLGGKNDYIWENQFS
jgi:hypothetical protein